VVCRLNFDSGIQFFDSFLVKSNLYFDFKLTILKKKIKNLIYKLNFYQKVIRCYLDNYYAKMYKLWIIKIP